MHCKTDRLRVLDPSVESVVKPQKKHDDFGKWYGPVSRLSFITMIGRFVEIPLIQLAQHNAL